MAPPKNQPSEPPFTHPSDAWTRAQFGRAADSEAQDVSGAEAVNPWVDGSSPSGGATIKPSLSNYLGQQLLLKRFSRYCQRFYLSIKMSS